jgi:hypothetical protein
MDNKDKKDLSESDIKASSSRRLGCVATLASFFHPGFDDAQFDADLLG